MNRARFGPIQGRPSPRLGLLAPAIAIIAASFVLAPRCQADLIIEVPDVIATAGSTGSFDVLIANTSAPGGASYQVGSDVLQVALANAPGVRFTGVNIGTATPYLFTLPGTTQGGGPFSSSPFPDAGFTASDSEFDPATGFQRTILPGQVFDLAHVSFDVSPGSAASVGMIDVVLATDGTATSLADAAGDAVPFGVRDGSITIAAVPGPSSLVLAACGCAASALVLNARRREPGRSGPAVLRV